MKAEGIMLEVECGLTISESTAVVCLKLLEMYCNSNNLYIDNVDTGDGTKVLYFKERANER